MSPRRWAIAASLLAVVVGGGYGVGWAGSNDDGGSSADQLRGTDWQLVEFTRGGQTTKVAAASRAFFGLDSAGGFYADACNLLAGRSAINARTLRLEQGLETQVGCWGPSEAVEDAFRAVMGPTVRWKIEGGILRLETRKGVQLVLEPDVTQLREPGSQILHAGRTPEGHEFRAAVTTGKRPTVRIRWRAAPGVAWYFAGAGTPSGPESSYALITDSLPGDELIAGLAPLDTVRVVYQRVGVPASDLEVHNVVGTRRMAFTGFIAGHRKGDRLIAYDSGGHRTLTCKVGTALTVWDCKRA